MYVGIGTRMDGSSAAQAPETRRRSGDIDLAIGA